MKGVASLRLSYLSQPDAVPPVSVAKHRNLERTQGAMVLWYYRCFYLRVFWLLPW